MIRNAFNGGEVSPNIAQRPDLDVHARACTRVENFDLSQTGGVRRRRGMRGLLPALPGSRLFSYVYSESLFYLVELGPSACRIVTPEGNIVFEWADSPWNTSEIAALRARQVNKHLFVTCTTQPVMVISTEDMNTWTLEPWKFKIPPLRHSGMRDSSVHLTRIAGKYKVVFDETETDRLFNNGDTLSVEIMVPTQTAFATTNEWRNSKTRYNFTSMTAASKAKAGNLVWVVEGGYDLWYECVKDFTGGDDFVAGRTRPADYPEHFVRGAPWGGVLTCKGTWKFQCSGTWYGELGIERRYPKENTWTCLATSFSPTGAARNLQPTGDESGEECYLRLRCYRTQINSAPPDSSSLTLEVSSYRKRLLLTAKGSASAEAEPITDFIIPANEECTLVLKDGETRVFDKIALNRSSPLMSDGGAFGPTLSGTVGRRGSNLYVTLDAPIDYAELANVTTEDGSHDEWRSMLFQFHFEEQTLRFDTLGEHLFLASNLVEVSTWTNRHVASGSRSSVRYSTYERTDWYGTPGWHIVWTDSSQLNEQHIVHPKYGNRMLNRIELSRNGTIVSAPVAEVHMPAGTMWLWSDFKADYAVRSAQSFEISDPVPESCPDSAESTVWSWEAFTRAYGYPALCDIYQQRLVFASTSAQRQTVWMSKTDDLNNFEISDEDDGSLAVTLSTTSQNPIVWMLAQNARLLLGTTNSEWTISGGDGGITASNARADNSGFVGSAAVPATMAVDKCLYIERGGGRAYQYGYNYEADAYMSADLTVFADHILRDGGGVVSGSFLRKPDPRAVFVLANGTLALMTYNTMHNVNAWHRYATVGKIESVAALPNGNKDDLLYLIVDRSSQPHPVATESVEGKRMIEVIAPENDYVDEGGRDYDSVLVTVPCGPAETQGTKRQSVLVGLCLGEPTPAGGIEISNNGQDWRPLDRDPAATLSKGWQENPAAAAWRRENSVGIRVTGNRGFSLFCVQSQEE